MKATHFVANRNFVLRSKIGHSIAFEKDKPQYVPAELHSEAMERGALPCDLVGNLESQDKVAPTEVPNDRKPVMAPDDEKARFEDIKAAIAMIVERNNSEDFAGPTPSDKAVSAITGYPVAQKAVRKVWEVVREGDKG